MKRIVVFLGLVFGCLELRAADDGALPRESRVMPSGRRMTIIYRAPGNKSRTNTVSWTWEKRVGERWVVESRSYFVAGEGVFSEYDFDENGVARELILRRADQLVGVKRKGTEIVGLIPEAELNEMVGFGKSGSEAGGLIGEVAGGGNGGKSKTG